MRRTYGQAILISSKDGQHGNEFGGEPLRVGQVGLADLLANSDYDALPADHGSQAERESDCDLDPRRNELGRVV